MQEKTKEPEIRFAGFTGAWEQRKLREIATFINGRAYSQNELLSAGKYRVLRVGNFYTNDSWYYSNLELADKYYALNGDLLYTWSATFGPHIWTGNKVIYHYHIWKVELSESLEKYFAVQLLERDKNKILNDKNGSTMVHVTKSGMENEEVVIPFSVLEQQKIGNFFKKLDSLLTLHQRKYEKLLNIKKSMLEKMFPKEGEVVPEIRFKGFTGAWEQRELGEISEIKTGPFGSSLHASDYVADGVPIITTEHFKFGSIEKNKYLIPMVSDTDHSRLIAYSLKTGDIVFSRVGSVDTNALVEPESDGWLFSGRVLRVRSSEKYDSGFLHNLLETDDVRNDIRNRAVGQTMPSINTQILSATELTIPSSKREQQRIGNFFKGINQLLTLHQRKLEMLKNVKQAFLEKMFV